MRALTIHIRSEHNEWAENYIEGERGSFPVGEPDLSVWAYNLVTRFNAGARPGETLRYVTKIEESEYTGPVKREHTWEKTNLITIVRGKQMYDTARCTVCGITAKRFGVGGYTRDPKFKDDKFEICSGPKE
jgi:hypothetical protein